jgi:hypothetical protein
MLNRQEQAARWFDTLTGKFEEGKSIVFEEWFRKIYHQEKNVEVPIDVCFSLIQKYGSNPEAIVEIEKDPLTITEDIATWKLKIHHLSGS